MSSERLADLVHRELSFERLAELAQREDALVAGGRWEDLVGLQAERDVAIAALPCAAGLAELPLLEHAARRSRATEGALVAEMARVGAQIAALGRGRRALSAYGSEPDARLDARG